MKKQYLETALNQYHPLCRSYQTNWVPWVTQVVTSQLIISANINRLSRIMTSHTSKDDIMFTYIPSVGLSSPERDNTWPGLSWTIWNRFKTNLQWLCLAQNSNFHEKSNFKALCFKQYRSYKNYTDWPVFFGWYLMGLVCIKHNPCH